MTRRQLDALKRIVEREARDIKERVEAGETCDRVAGAHRSGDRYVVSDRGVSVSCGEQPKGLPVGDPIADLEDILDDHLKEPAWIMDVTEEQTEAWEALARANRKAVGGKILMSLSTVELYKDFRRATFDPQRLWDAVDAVGDGAALYLCKGIPYEDTTIYPLLVCTGDWELNKNMAYACVLNMRVREDG